MSEERPEMKKRRDLRRRLLGLMLGMAQVILAVLIARFCVAQVTGGGIAGTITDQSGAAVGQTHITVRNLATGFDRTLNAAEDGSYSVAALPAGKYEVKAEAQGFRSMTLQATVEVGTTTTVNLAMELGSVSEAVYVVADATPQMKYEQHEVGGVVTRDQIQSLPLNGRNFLDLARLEPGVTGPERNTNNRTNTPLLGVPRNGTNTLVTIDGGSVMLAFSRGSVMNFSQEGVQEFQIGTVNLDLSTGPTTTGNVNIVTRSGGNDFRGSGFYFFRGHQLAAYPGLIRDPKNPDPFFQRQQFGFDAGGPLLRNRAFFFVNTERNDQRSVVSVQPRTAEFAPLGGLFASPYRGTQFSARFDLRLTANENAFVRYSHDGNTQFAPNGSNTTAPLPSSWSRLPNWVDQTGGALTSSLSPTLVNDVRFFYLFISTPEQPPESGDCPGTCVGRGAPGIDIPGAGLSLGFSQRLSFVERNYQLSENLTWQKGSHRLRFGAEFQRERYSGFGIREEPAQLNLYAPSEVRQYNASHPADAQIPLPSSFLTTKDILSLPLRSFMTGIGNGHEAYPGFRKFRSFEMYRWYAGDVWRLFPSLTVNYGLSWAYEPHDLNYDLSKPQVLQPLLGQAGLRPPGASAKNFSPKIGF